MYKLLVKPLRFNEPFIHKTPWNLLIKISAVLSVCLRLQSCSVEYTEPFGHMLDISSSSQYVVCNKLVSCAFAVNLLMKQLTQDWKDELARKEQPAADWAYVTSTSFI